MLMLLRIIIDKEKGQARSRPSQKDRPLKIMADKPDKTAEHTPQWLAKHQYIDSQLLFGDERKVVIKHNDEWYHLQITKTNKLILTK